MSSTSEVTAFRAELESLARWSGRSLAGVEDEISEREMELEEREAEHSEGIERHGYGSPAPTDMPDADIQSLFSTLRDDH